MNEFPSWAVPGRKVVCVQGGRIENVKPTHAALLGYPVKGEIYTIRDIGRWMGDRESINVMIYEVPNPWLGDWTDSGWSITRFRPLVTLEEDMEVFNEMLRSAPVSAPVDSEMEEA